jgi:hypothetical protein
MTHKLIEDNIELNIERRINSEVRKNIVEVYQDLLQTIWEKMLPTLGVITVVAITKRSVIKAGEKYPLIANLIVSEEGISFEAIKERIKQGDKEEIKAAFKHLIATLFDILAKLTGNILIGQLVKEIDSLQVES